MENRTKVRTYPIRPANRWPYRVSVDFLGVGGGGGGCVGKVLVVGRDITDGRMNDYWWGGRKFTLTQ